MNKEEEFKRMMKDAVSTKQRLFYSAVYLFSTKGFSNVGIRELCYSVNIKESAFYNHYRSKDELFSELIKHFIEMSSKEIFTEQQTDEIVDNGDIELYLTESMKAYSQVSDNPLYYTLLQIILMESYTNHSAYELVSNNAYYSITETVLERMMENGLIKNLDAKAFTSSYYYGLKGIMQEYLLREVWNEDTAEMQQKMKDHINLLLQIIKTER